MNRAFHVFVVSLFSAVFVFRALSFAALSEYSGEKPIHAVAVSGSNCKMGVHCGEQDAELIAANQKAIWKLPDTRAMGNGKILDRNAMLKPTLILCHWF
ncbi:MAG: hypothetical protein JXA73_12905 [Acidobacteria bacterium]|nr:hypothetical protein [Acidobacteriota bacterium]